MRRILFPLLFFLALALLFFLLENRPDHQKERRGNLSTTRDSTPSASAHPLPESPQAKGRVPFDSEWSYPLRVLAHEDAKPLAAVRVAVLALDGSFHGVLETDEEGRVPLPFHGPAIASFQAPGRFGVQAWLPEEKEDTEDLLISLWPSGSLQVEFAEDEDHPISGIRCVLLPDSEDLRKVGSLEESLMVGDRLELQAIQDLFLCSQFLEGLEHAVDSDIHDFLEGHHWQHLLGRLPWHGKVPDPLETPAWPFQWAPLSNDSGNVVWLRLPAMKGYRLRVLSQVDTVLTPPNETPAFGPGSKGGIAVRSQIPARITGSFEILPGEAKLLRESIRRRARVRGRVFRGFDGPWGKNDQVAMQNIVLHEDSEGKPGLLAFHADKETPLRGDGSFSLETVPGRKYLRAFWTKDRRDFYFAEADFTLNPGDDLDLGDLTASPGEVLHIHPRLQNPSTGEAWHPSDLGFSLASERVWMRLKELRNMGVIEGHGSNLFLKSEGIQDLRIHGLHAGSWALHYFTYSDSSTPGSRSYRIASPPDRIPFTLPKDSVLEVPLEMSLLRRLLVRVKWKNGEPEGSCAFYLIPKQPEPTLVFSGTAVHGRSTPEGTLEQSLWVAPGDYRLVAGSFYEPQDPPSSALPSPVIPYASELVHLEARDPPTIEVELGEGAALHGYLRDQAGQAVSDRICSLLPEGWDFVNRGQGPYQARTGTNGEFLFRGLPPHTSMYLRSFSMLPEDSQIVTTGDPGSTTETLLTELER